MNSPAKVLIQGIGNPLRSDDALGPMMIERLEASSFVETCPNVQTEWVYQLQIENAEQWSHFDVVILVDAHVSQSELVHWVELKTPQMVEDSIEPGAMSTSSAGQSLAGNKIANSVSSHSLDPLAILCLAEKCYPKVPRAYLLSIYGRNFEMGTGLSKTAQCALDEAERVLHVQVSQYFENLGSLATLVANGRISGARTP